MEDDTRELLDDLAEKERRSPDEPFPYEELADDLEEYGTSRADFRQLSQSQREAVAKWLHRARVQARQYEPEDEVWETCSTWRNELEKKRTFYFHTCGQLNISFKEARAMWWSYVYERAPPYRRKYLV